MKCPKGYVEVIATAPGFYGIGKMGSRIAVDETFYVKEGSPVGGWFRVLHPEDAGKLAPSKKAEKLARKQAANAASRLAKDPSALVQTVKELVAANAPMQIPAGKILQEPAAAKTGK